MKTHVQIKGECDLELYAVYIELVQENNSIGHQVIYETLAKSWVAARLPNVVQNRFMKFSTIIQIEKEKRGWNLGCGVRQGDNLVPTVFILVTQIMLEIREQIRSKHQNLTIMPA